MDVPGKYEKLQTIAKLLNSEPKILVDFFVDVGLEVLSRTQVQLLKELKTHLDGFIEKIDNQAPASSKNQLSILDEIKK